MTAPASGEIAVTDPDQSAALSALQDGRSIHLTGGAGAGKSTVIRRFLSQTDRRIARLATTGGAAQLIGGITVHRFFELGPEVYQPGTKRVSSGLRRRLARTDGLLIDEASMLRIDKFQEIRDALFQCARGYGDFAGFQVVLAGDFAQLPPVMTDQDRTAIEALYGPDQLFAFQSRHWMGLATCNLATLHRQADDLTFAQMLDAIRRGEVPDLAPINARVAEAPAEAVRLVARNVTANEINGRMMEAIPGKHFRIEGETQGAFMPRDMRVNPQLILKPGARVIICANGADGAYVNGSTGTFVAAARDADGRPTGQVALDSGATVTVPRHTWQAISYDVGQDHTGAAEVSHHVVGSYTQLPILPGYAITVHRAQGMTIQQMHFDPEGSFEAGQIYVALSRVPRLEGLTLSREIALEEIRQDPRVSAFQQMFAPRSVPDAVCAPAPH